MAVMEGEGKGLGMGEMGNLNMFIDQPHQEQRSLVRVYSARRIPVVARK